MRLFVARSILVVTTLATALTACSSDPTTPATVSSGEWRPSHPARVRQLSDAERMELRRSSLEREAKALNLKPMPPIPALIRFVGLDEQPKVLADCLTRGGFPAVVAPDGSIDYPNGIPAEQAKAYGLVEFHCRAQYSLDPKYQVAFTKEQAVVIYEYFTQALVPCLASHGVKGISSPPSQDVWVAQFLAAQEGVGAWWNPYREVPVPASNTEAAKLRSECRELPPAQYLYG